MIFFSYFVHECEMKELCYIACGQVCRLVLRVRALRGWMRSLPRLEIAQARNECYASAGRNYRQSETLLMDFKFDGVEEVQR